MIRLINAQDAFNVLSDYYHHSTHVQHLALQEALNKVPTVDAEPVRHGKWVPKYIRICGQDWVSGMKCSECGEDALNAEGDEFLTDYCPNCGARMDEDERD